MTEQSFRDLKIGDKVERWIGHSFFMNLEIIKVDEQFIYCDALQLGKRVGFTPNTGWKFDRDIGCEEDISLGWGKNLKRTGTYLKRKEQSDGGLPNTDEKKPIVP